MAEPNFDPDKYLATKPSTEDFDPDAFLRLVETSFSGAEFKPETTGTVVDQIPTGGYPAPAFVETPNLSTGQKVYQNIVRPVLAPTIEMVKEEIMVLEEE